MTEEEKVMLARLVDASVTAVMALQSIGVPDRVKSIVFMNAASLVIDRSATSEASVVEAFEKARQWLDTFEKEVRDGKRWLKEKSDG